MSDKQSIEDKIREITDNLIFEKCPEAIKELAKLFKDEIETWEISYQQLEECFVGRGDELKEKDEQIKQLTEIAIPTYEKRLRQQEAIIERLQED